MSEILESFVVGVARGAGLFLTIYAAVVLALRTVKLSAILNLRVVQDDVEAADATASE